MSTENGGSGCLKWFLIGVGAVVLFMLIFLFGGYYVLMHTAWPVKKVVAAMIEGSNVEVKGIEGSLSSGFTVEEIRYPDANGNITELEDLGFKYEQGDKAFIITDMHIARGHIYVDDLHEFLSEDDDTGSVGGRNNQFPESEPLNLIVREIDISDITIEDVKTGEKIIIDKIFLDGFECIDDNLKLGTLTVKSNHCNIEIKPVDDSAELGKEHVIKGIIKKSIHETILKDITINGKFVAGTPKSYELDLQLFDGKINFNQSEPNEKLLVNVNNFTPNEYIASVFCFKDVNLKYSATDRKGKADVAEFKIGRKVFKIEKDLFNDMEEKDLVAFHSEGKTEYKCVISNEDKTLFPKVKLSSRPSMNSKDILSMLIFDCKYDKLKPIQKSELDKQLKLTK